MEKSYKFRIYPNNEQIHQIKNTFGCCRYVYNYFLVYRTELYKTCGKNMGYSSLCNELTNLKAIDEWLYEADSTALQSSLKNLDNAYNNFFRRIKQGENPGFPQFKNKKNQSRSYKSKNNVNTIELKDRYIKLPKLGLVRAAISKNVYGRILSATVSLAPSGKYFISLCCTEVTISQHKPTGAVIGLDMGIKNLVVTSDGIFYPSHKFIKKSENKLAKAQQRLSRKPRGSKNRDIARIKVAKIQEKITNQRTDTLHKFTTQLVKDYDVICTEDLAIKNMIRNHIIAKSLVDASWGELARQIKYKCEWHNKVFIKVGRFYPSSQICNECGYQNNEVKKLSLRSWMCQNCKTTHDRDYNAAKNILKEGLCLKNH